MSIKKNQKKQYHLKGRDASILKLLLNMDNRLPEFIFTFGKKKEVSDEISF